MKPRTSDIAIRDYVPTENHHGKTLMPRCFYHPLRDATKVVSGTSPDGLPIQQTVCESCAKLLLSGSVPIREIPDSMKPSQSSKESTMPSVPKPSAKKLSAKAVTSTKATAQKKPAPKTTTVNHPSVLRSTMGEKGATIGQMAKALDKAFPKGFGDKGGIKWATSRTTAYMKAWLAQKKVTQKGDVYRVK